MPTIYLKGLNGIRAIAAMAVIHAHTSMRLPDFGISELAHSDLAGFGVTVFFSLSGFLITFLLINEINETSSINIHKFYVRRVLRIWPLYFFYLLINIFAVYIFTNIFYPDRIGYYLTFLPNIPYVFGGQYPNVGHYWSLGVEEQFYLFWPVFILYARRNMLMSLLMFIGVFLMIKVGALLYFGGYSSEYTFIYVTRFDCMAIGALGAWVYKWYPLQASYLAHTAVQIMAWSVIALTAFSRFHIFSVIDHEIMAAITVCLIIGQVMQEEKKSFISLENKYLDFLGKISFGLYVYHPLLIFLLSNIIHFEQYSLINILCVYLVVLLISVLIAYISYRYLETPFLRLKNKFSVVKSTASLTSNA